MGAFLGFKLWADSKNLGINPANFYRTAFQQQFFQNLLLVV